MNELPKLVRVDWYTGDITLEKPIEQTKDFYFFDVKDNGSYWAAKIWCTILN
jgi:hypothetical protein